MKERSVRYKNATAFGKALGLSEIDMQLSQEKTKLIKKLKEARESKGMSQASLAKILKSQQPAIARMESGLVSQVSMDFLLRVALVLGVSVSINSKKAA
jgi:ribosome-binding protein aMBF1 (putative translation factor)